MPLKLVQTKERPFAHELVKQHAAQIKKTVETKFSVDPSTLSFLLEDTEGAYFSAEEPHTLCCFVLGKENGFLYIVTAKIDKDGKTLTDFKTDIVS